MAATNLMIDMTGVVQGHLRVIERAPTPEGMAKESGPYWRCECTCGAPDCKREVILKTRQLKNPKRIDHRSLCGGAQENTGRKRIETYDRRFLKKDDLVKIKAAEAKAAGLTYGQYMAGYKPKELDPSVTHVYPGEMDWSKYKG